MADKQEMIPFYWNGEFLGNILKSEEATVRGYLERLRDGEEKLEEPPKEEERETAITKEQIQYNTSGNPILMNEKDKEKFVLEWELVSAYYLKDWNRVRRVIECIRKKQQ